MVRSGGQYRAGVAMSFLGGDAPQSLESLLGGSQDELGTGYTPHPALAGGLMTDPLCPDGLGALGAATEYGGSSDAARLGGDFYQEAGMTTRGLTIGPGAVDMGEALFDKRCAVQAEATPCSSSFERFTAGDQPPMAPSSPFFSYMATTMFVSGAAPNRLANLLLDFLLIDAAAIISKVRKPKYSIKADVQTGFFGAQRLVSYHPCTLKIKLYMRDDDCAVEFRKCSGDAVVFNDVYQKASRYLQTQASAKYTFQS